ncbi:carbohydrate ABC transporter permease [Rhodobium gokarnense]|uniref:Maltose/maltodextrin transport system permease protein MalG n=1 Tax=Rhodobium gokarnense TaxID=364296 RepID=A0ABT3H657_9HYPH|nr:carbohydrate ABC transporter permease [Rhodobium gokarnense]MCW2305861.1 ABC-type glycerol-3-phosphate transport system permease component [Rhodobium gokarnense]
MTNTVGQSRLASLAVALLVALAIVIVLFPFLWIFLASIKPASVVALPDVWTFSPTAKNWNDVLLGSDVPKNILNSLIVSVVTVSVALFTGAPAAYSFSRYKTGAGFRFTILAAEMMPPAILILPLFLILYQLGLIDSLMGVILAHLTFVVPVVTWFLIGFFDDVPRELEDQAMIDGYTRFQAFYKVILPAIRPGIAAAAVFGFVLSWNDMFYALILTGGESKTLPVAIAGFWTFRGIDMGKMAVAILIAVVPILIVSFFIQKHLVRGLGGGAVKF